MYGKPGIDQILCIRQNAYDMFEQRKNKRYPATARAHIPDLFKGEALLKDLSITGCCIESTMYVDIKLGVQYKVEIIPEAVSRIEKFELLVKSCWIRTGGYSCEIGFSVIASPRGKSFERYVDYLSWRSVAP
jgi:hypothetical protein